MVITLKGLWYVFLLPPRQSRCGCGYSNLMSMGGLAHVPDGKKELDNDVHRLALFGVHLEGSQENGFMVHRNSDYFLEIEIKSKKRVDPLLMEFKESVLGKFNELFYKGRDGLLRYKGRLYVTDVNDLRRQIIEEAHGSWYIIHTSAMKMYSVRQEIYWLNYLKKHIVEFFAKGSNS